MYALIDRVSFYNFKMAAMTSFHAEKFCHLVSAHATCAWRLCSSVRQFLIYSTVHSYLLLVMKIVQAVPCLVALHPPAFSSMACNSCSNV